MFNRIITTLVFVTAINVFQCYTQNGWNIYTAMKDVRSVSISGNNIWAASTGGLFTFEQNNTAGMKKFTSLDGLLSNELTAGIADLNGNIWTGAADGSISVYYPSTGTFKVVTDIRNSTEPSKQINHFFQYGNNMFFATRFCLIKFSISQFQFVDQPYIALGPDVPLKSPVNWIHVVNDTIWAATSYGIAYANVNSSLPIRSSWKNFTTLNSVLNKNLINSIAYFNNSVYFGTDSGMVYFQNGTLSKYEPLYNGSNIRDPIRNIYSSGNALYFNTYKYTNRIYKAGISNLNNAELIYDGNPVNNFKVLSNGDLILGTKYRGVDIFSNNNHTSIFPNGPHSNLVYNMNVDMHSNLWIVSGSLGDWVDESGVYKFDGTSWKNYTAAQYPQMGTSCCGYVQVYSSRNGSDVWISGFGLGLLKINGDNLTRYTDTNSILFPISPGFVLVEGIKEDNNGDLWLINRAAPQPIVNYTTGEKYAVPVYPQFNTLYYMVIDNYNTKWMTFPPVEGGGIQGICYFNEDIPTGLIINASQLGPNITSVSNIALDKNGEVWVATNNGISVIPDPAQVINTPNSIPYSIKMRIIENGISTPLTEDINCIGVDALNNKWIGTASNGLIYVSPDGSTLLARYNTLNSPLPDNKITSIVCDNNNGTVYFGTTKGVVSYKTIAINPLAECDKLKAGPNPFTIPSDKMMKIDGLVEESSVKILTISGTLVKEFDSPGGRVAEWDGRDTYGNLVSSGIYILVGFNKDGSKTCTGKVAIVRK